MAAVCCFMWCMRYNPSQALRLLLDPLISAASAKLLNRFRGFLHSGSGKPAVTCSRASFGHAPSMNSLHFTPARMYRRKA
ncbi:hypothetical protein BFG07_14085 [Kosakonia cowanii]|nr:hypothetical protein BFG07_14085 [Kosakonia cowanii]